jgi:hypothetical protein
VRSLTEMGLMVIVDAPPNSDPQDLLSSLRQDITTVDSMPDALILSEFPSLVQSVAAFTLQHVALAVVGGVPAKAIQLVSLVRSASAWNR